MAWFRRKTQPIPAPAQPSENPAEIRAQLDSFLNRRAELELRKLELELSLEEKRVSVALKHQEEKIELEKKRATLRAEQRAARQAAARERNQTLPRVNGKLASPATYQCPICYGRNDRLPSPQEIDWHWNNCVPAAAAQQQSHN